MKVYKEQINIYRNCNDNVDDILAFVDYPPTTSNPCQGFLVTIKNV